MTGLPEIQLDDRGFQDLVSEARLRIARTCPEWTEHNVSDPGVTLIELFAWMTELTIYRLNRVPDKLHVALLDLLGIRLAGPSAARTALRFRLAQPPAAPIVFKGGHTEAGTPRTATDESIVFEVDEDFTLAPARPAAYVLDRGGRPKSVGVADGVARPQGPDQHAFAQPPVVGDAICLGFEDPLARLLVQVEIEASQARGAGIDPDDPPLRWEVSQPDGGWAECEVLEDLTGGFNLGSGTVLLQLPPASAILSLAGERRHWLRCRIADRTRRGTEGTAYANPPEIYSITAAPVGALLPATHASRVTDEVLGVSDGTPGQVFRLRSRPLLRPEPRDTLEVRAPGEDWVAWEARESFAGSRATDRHFVLDAVSGEVELGPAIREAGGGWRQAGAIPPKGATLRFSSYRHGGGRAGNVAAGSVTVLRAPLAGVDRVTNPLPAVGGVDAEPLEHARRRAAMEIRSRSRAVTAEDFEYLAGEASPRVARAACLAPDAAGVIPLHLLPRVAEPDRRLEQAELEPDGDLLGEVAEYLEERRLIGTTVQLLPFRFRGLSVVVSLQATPLADLPRVQEDVAHALYTYLNPLVGGSPAGPGSGWPTGRPLNQGELYGIVHGVAGVEFVRMLRMYETDLATGEQSPQPAGTHILLEPGELIASGQHIVKATYADP